MAKSNLLKQFRTFYSKNYPEDMEKCIEYFGVFGGLDVEVDTTKPILQLVEELILSNFISLQEHIDLLLDNDKNAQRLLRAFAIGDRRIFSAFNRAGLNNGNGGAILQTLEQKGIVTLEYSREATPKQKEKIYKHKLPKQERHRVSHKVLFTQPFIRFWFYFVTKYINEIREKNYTNFVKNFQQKYHSYTSLVFEELSEVLLDYHLRDAQVVSSGSYWDAKVEIDILTITSSGEFFVAECKWTNHIVNKKEYHKLKEKCQYLKIEPTQIIFFLKRGFSKELLSMQSKSLALFSANDFEVLVKNSNV